MEVLKISPRGYCYGVVDAMVWHDRLQATWTCRAPSISWE